MKFRHRSATLAAVVALLIGAAVPATARPPEMATGDVTWSTSGGLGDLDVHSTFAAHASGKGQITMELRRLDGTYVETWSGTVTCLERDGDVATFGGTVDSTDDPDRENLTNFVVRVWDNGEGGDAVDQINSGRTSNASQSCNWFGYPPKPVSEGNLQVHV